MPPYVKSRRLRLSMLAAAALMAVNASTFAQALPATALPAGWNVTSGSASFAQIGATLNINQTSQQAIVNFASFNVGSGATVNIQQLNSSAAMLARVTGNDPSQILGQINASGTLWLINQAGIMVGPGARIDVSRFIASSLNISDSDFLANRLNFKGASTGTPGTVRNAGTINAASGGSIYLVGGHVENTGLLNAPGGEILLAAGQTVELKDTATPGVSIVITGTPGEVRNLGQITADAGRIGLAAGLVSNSGTINASSAVREGGRVFLRASGDIQTAATSAISANGTTGGNVVLIAENSASIDGRVSATGSAGSGGYVDTSGKASLDVVNVPTVGQGGEWHIDPYNIEIVAAGPDNGITGTNAIVSQPGGAQISAATIVDQLNAGTNVSITTGRGDPTNDATFGDITVSAAINKTGAIDSALTLSAHNNIVINAPITSTASKLDLNLRSNSGNNYPDTNHAVQLNANLNLNGGLLKVSQQDGDGDGTLNIASGTTTLNNGTSAAINAAGITVAAGSTLTGSGNINLRVTGTLTNNGTVSPGASNAAGTLAIDGNYAQGSAGVLNVKLGAADSFDKLTATGSANLNGRLNVSVLNSFVPDVASTYDFLVAPGPGNSGTFSSVNPASIGSDANNRTVSVTYPGTANTVSRITALAASPTPAPASSVNTCTIAPNSAACQVLSAPAVNSLPVVSINLNTSINNVALSKPPTTAPGSSIADLPISIPAASSTTASGDDTKVGDKKDAGGAVSVAKVEPAKKMYCN